MNKTKRNQETSGSGKRTVWQVPHCHHPAPTVVQPHPGAQRTEEEPSTRSYTMANHTVQSWVWRTHPTKQTCSQKGTLTNPGGGLPLTPRNAWGQRAKGPLERIPTSKAGPQPGRVGNRLRWMPACWRCLWSMLLSFRVPRPAWWDGEAPGVVSSCLVQLWPIAYAKAPYTELAPKFVLFLP